MRLQDNPYFPADLAGLVRQVSSLWRELAAQVNGLSEGTIQAAHNAYTAAPTTGTHQQGDVVRNSAPSELGTAGSKYVVTHFLCTAAGTPGTWVQCRSLTGN